jgi:hypothetical protein
MKCDTAAGACWASHFFQSPCWPPARRMGGRRPISTDDADLTIAIVAMQRGPSCGATTNWRRSTGLYVGNAQLATIDAWRLD